MKCTGCTLLKGMMLLLIGMLAPAHVFGAATETQRTQAVHVFAGRYTRETTGGSANLFKAKYENNYSVGLAYSRDFRPIATRGATGGEAGLAARFPERLSGEIWGGFYLRHIGIPILRTVLVKPSLTLGLSLVDRAIGMERERQRRRDGDVRLLYYFGPELSFSAMRNSEWEVVCRLHHRSGGMRTLGNMTEGHNATTIGLRRRF